MSEPTPEWSDLMRWARRSLAFTPKRRKEHAKRIKKVMSDPAVKERHRAAMKLVSERTRAERTARLLEAARKPGHPFEPLPPMSKKERTRYRYIRSMTSRENALAVIMAERKERGGE